MYDMKKLQNLHTLESLAPEAWNAFAAFDETARAEGAIPQKYKELIALAVALTTQCVYCLEIHRREAVDAGATAQEMAEVALVTAALRAGAAATHATHLFER